MNWIKYRSVLLIFIISLYSFTSFGQNVTIKQDKFPIDWVGDWSGKLEVFNAEGLKRSLNMELLIHPIENAEHYEWSIIYGADKEKGLRAYELHPKSPENGIWAVDEKNGIILECYLLDNKLFSSYRVAERNFLVSYEKRENELIFEISFGSEDPVSETGGIKTEDEEEIPEVKAFEIAGLQRAILKRSK